MRRRPCAAAGAGGDQIAEVLTMQNRPDVRRVTEWGKQKYAGSLPEHLWHRLDALDFMNQAIILAATLLLCGMPFFLVLSALAGRSAAKGLAAHLGLNQQASADVGHMFASSAATSAGVTGTAWVFFILAGIATAASIQGLYERAFDLAPQRARDMPRKLVWLGLAVGWFFLQGWAAHWVRRGGPALLVIVGLAAFTAFWGFTMEFLLAGRVPWRRLIPPAVATGVLFVAMLTVFSFILSGMIISYTREYGAIGTVFGLMAWLIGCGVVVILGAAVGLVWHERGLSFRAAFGKARLRQ
jgi:membrane protein